MHLQGSRQSHGSHFNENGCKLEYWFFQYYPWKHAKEDMCKTWQNNTCVIADWADLLQLKTITTTTITTTATTTTATTITVTTITATKTQQQQQ